MNYLRWEAFNGKRLCIVKLKKRYSSGGSVSIFHFSVSIFPYNDISAIGSIRAFQEAGLQVPKDVFVVGFDYIRLAVHNNPRLTTVRQPLERMGEIAARTLLKRLEDHASWVPKIAIEPELAVRDSTGPAPPERTVARNGSFAANHA